MTLLDRITLVGLGVVGGAAAGKYIFNNTSVAETIADPRTWYVAGAIVAANVLGEYTPAIIRCIRDVREDIRLRRRD